METAKKKIPEALMEQGKIELGKPWELVIIGGGPAGLAAGLAARKSGLEEILIVERDHRLGGILNQCIHNGFGLHTFQEELTGPEYAGRYIQMVEEAEIPYVTDTMVLDIQALEDGRKQVMVMNQWAGLQTICCKAVILAMGCRERPRGALNIPGYRPAGIYSAGTAQKYVNIDGYLPGKEVVILGSGDIGLIMARRMTLEGARVKVVAELMPYSGGLKRNIVQCLEDYGIPLELSTTVVGIEGRDRVSGVTLAKVDAHGKPISGTERYVACDTLLLSVGLIPENELSEQAGIKLQPATSGAVVAENMETNIPGIFACGNVLHVHDLVDFVSEEAAHAGRSAAVYCRGFAAAQKKESGDSLPSVITISPEHGVRYTVPSEIWAERFLAGEEADCTIRFRVSQVFRNVRLQVSLDGTVLLERKKRAMAPGEMEEIKLRRDWIRDWTDTRRTTEGAAKAGNEKRPAGRLEIRICEEVQSA